MRKVLIAVKEPGKAWEVRKVDDQLQVYQEIVSMTSDGIMFGPVYDEDLKVLGVSDAGS